MGFLGKGLHLPYPFLLLEQGTNQPFSVDRTQVRCSFDFVDLHLERLGKFAFFLGLRTSLRLWVAHGFLDFIDPGTDDLRPHLDPDGCEVVNTEGMSVGREKRGNDDGNEFLVHVDILQDLTG